MTGLTAEYLGYFIRLKAPMGPRDANKSAVWLASHPAPRIPDNIISFVLVQAACVRAHIRALGPKTETEAPKK